MCNGGHQLLLLSDILVCSKPDAWHSLSGRVWPESDNPGELLWIAGEHWLLFQNATWLQTVGCLRPLQSPCLCHKPQDQI